MNEANVISVDPGVKTLGELCVNDHRLARISRKISGPGRKVAAPFRHIMNLLFGINRRVNSQLSGKMMILRLTCGTMFILMALLPMEMTDILAARFTADSIMLCAIGISMNVGHARNGNGYIQRSGTGSLQHGPVSETGTHNSCTEKYQKGTP